MMKPVKGDIVCWHDFVCEVVQGRVPPPQKSQYEEPEMNFLRSVQESELVELDESPLR